MGQQRSPAHAHVLDYVRGCGGFGWGGVKQQCPLARAHAFVHAKPLPFSCKCPTGS